MAASAAGLTVLGAGLELHIPLKLTVLKKKSKMKVNGKPVNHFKRGVWAKVVWMTEGSAKGPRRGE